MTRIGITGWARYWWDRILGEATKFGIIGFAGLFIDNGAFAFFRYGWFGPANGPLYEHPKLASFAATAVATLVSWMANRHWTYRDRPRSGIVREGVLFALFNVVGALITMACVAFAIDVLGLHGLGWESVARNIGIVLGTVFRFWSYRTFVFVGDADRSGGAPPAGAAAGYARVPGTEPE